MSIIDMVIVGLFFGLIALTSTTSGAGPREVFTNHFYVELEQNFPSSEVHRLAKRHGFVNLGPVSTFPNTISLSNAGKSVAKSACCFTICRLKRSADGGHLLGRRSIADIYSDAFKVHQFHPTHH
jgi:hypothetical protein